MSEILGGKGKTYKNKPTRDACPMCPEHGQYDCPHMPLLPPLGNKDPCSFQGIYFCAASLKMESVLPGWDSTQSQSVDELSFTGAASHRKLTPSFLGGGVGSTCLKQMCFSKVQRSGLRRKCGGVGEGKGRVILKTMYFSFPVNHIALRFLTLWINGINCLGVRGSKCHLGQRSHCSA